MIFRDLNFRLVCSPYVMVAYPPSLTASIYNDYTFGVWQHAEELLPLNAQSVLYSVIYLH